MTIATTRSGLQPLALDRAGAAGASAGAAGATSYTISYTNSGADDASDIVITDTLPAGVTLVSATAPGLSFNGATSGNLVWRLPTLDSQETGSIVVVV